MLGLMFGKLRGVSSASGALAVVVTVVTAVGSGCGARGDQATPDSPIQRQPVAIAERAMATRGEIVRVYPNQPFDPLLVDSAGSIVRAVYRSASGVSGASSLVAGFFAVPKGSPPAGGWPVVSFAHGTTGIEHGCGPSGRPDLLGNQGTAIGLLVSGYAVAMTDYQGLDDLSLHPLQEPGPHPFLEPDTAAYNVIDAVRAIRHLFPDVSARWAAAGASQGGQAVWAADEFNNGYGQDLDLVGAIALAPAANITALAELAFKSTLTSQQRGVLPLVIIGLQRSGLLPDVKAYLRGDVVTNEEDILGCAADAGVARSKVRGEDVVPDSAAAVDDLRHALQMIALPQQPLSAPLLVVNGKHDETIAPPWVSFAVASSCKTGGRIQHIELEDAGHDIGLITEQPMRWLKSRFDGGTTESNCPG